MKKFNRKSLIGLMLIGVLGISTVYAASTSKVYIGAKGILGTPTSSGAEESSDPGSGNDHTGEYNVGIVAYDASTPNKNASGATSLYVKSGAGQTALDPNVSVKFSTNGKVEGVFGTYGALYHEVIISGLSFKASNDCYIFKFTLYNAESSSMQWDDWDASDTRFSPASDDNVEVYVTYDRTNFYTNGEAIASSPGVAMAGKQKINANTSKDFYVVIKPKSGADFSSLKNINLSIPLKFGPYDNGLMS